MKFLRIAILIPLFVMLGYFGTQAYHAAKAYECSTAEIAQLSDASGLAQGKLDYLTSVISFGLIKDKRQAKLMQLKKEQTEHQQQSRQYLYYFLVLLAVIILFSLSCTLTGMTLVLAIGSLVSLILGLVNPILMVTIHKEIEHLGDVILSFESKGIMGSVGKLFESGESVVALTILLFSVIIPIVKISTLIFTLIFKQFRFAHHLVSFFKHLGKWSMVDVFVVAIFLVYLTSNQGEVSRAEIQIGLYFFLIYVILSMITTMLTQKAISPSSHLHDQKMP
jgi:hypothetical protein